MASMNKTPSQIDIASTLAHLQLSTKDPQKPLYKPKSKPVADSWDDESDTDNTDGSPIDDDNNNSNSNSNSKIHKSNNAVQPPCPDTSSTTTTTALTSPLSPTAPSLCTSPHPPPPTPASPTLMDDFPDNTPYSHALGPRSRGNSSAGWAGAGTSAGTGPGAPDKRPEKTTAVAGRLIAGALGVRAPRRTEEEREFDRVTRERERRRREEERERERREEEERARRVRAVWED